MVLGTLLGPVRSQRAAIGLLRRARLADGDAHAASLLTGYERLYPPQRSDPSEASGQLEAATLVPLRPDRLGEDLVGLHRLHDALPSDVNPGRRADRLLILGNRLADLGDNRGALAPTQEAVAIYAELVTSAPRWP